MGHRRRPGGARSRPRPPAEPRRPAAPIQAAGGGSSSILRCSRGNRRNPRDRTQTRGGDMAKAVRKSEVRQVPLSEVKGEFSRFLREAEKQDIIITRHGKPAGVLIGFASEDDWIEYSLENDPRFLRRIRQARESLRSGRGVSLDDIDAG